MDQYQERFGAFGLSIPNILLPVQSIDMKKWGVIACDQFTSEPGYWADVEKEVGTAPSTLRMILPECFLDDADTEKRIEGIHSTMEDYLHRGILRECGEGFILVKRTPQASPARYGLVAAVDLEQYDYAKDSRSLIRASEGTILSRIPPRVRIRQDALLELPHILVLIDDHEKGFIEPLVQAIPRLPLLYDTPLMLGGGHLAGYAVREHALYESMLKALERLARPQRSEELYGMSSNLLFAVGDGNHSLATARAVWEKMKKANPRLPEDHPARYALVEIINIYDSGLIFHPIHRILFHADRDDVLASLSSVENMRVTKFSGDPHIKARELPQDTFLLIGGSSTYQVSIIAESAKDRGASLPGGKKLTVDILQSFIDEYLAQRKGISIDYVHGEDSAIGLGRMEGNVAFILPAMEKRLFFQTIVHDGVLPRKTFSIGEAREKRYYFECRKIR